MRSSSVKVGTVLRNTLSQQLSDNRILFAIFVLAILLRVGVAVYLGDTVPTGKDETSYSVLATRLVEGHGYSFPEPWYPFTEANVPTAHWSFLYTALVGAVYFLAGNHPLAVRLASAIAGGVLLPWMTYRLSLRAIPDRRRVALLATGCAAVYAYFVLFAAQLLTETFFIVCVLWSLERAMALEESLNQGKPGSYLIAVGLGLSLGLATLLRQSILPWMFLLTLWLLWLGHRRSELKKTVFSLTLTILIVLLMILPFTVRNFRAYRGFLLLNSNAGYAMYSAQHPLHGTNFQAFTAAPLPNDLIGVAQNEAQWDRQLMARGIQFIVEQPLRYLKLSLSRTADFFMFWPSKDTVPINNIGRVLSFGLFLPIMAYGLWLSRARWRSLQLLYLFMLFYSVIHLLTWAMVRYRLPVDAVLLVFAAVATDDLAWRMGIWQNRSLERKTTRAGTALDRK